MYDSLVRFVRDQYCTQEFIPLHAPVFAGNEQQYVSDTIASTFVSSVGAFVDRFEHDMQVYTGSPRAVATVNGTAALHIALLLAGVKTGELVITQSLTFVATCNAIAYCGAEPVFVDVDRDTLGLSPAALEQWLDAQAVIGEDGLPYRVGYALGNEFSDHVMERRNYLYLAHSKLRYCAYGPELRVGELPRHLVGRSRIIRDAEVLWEKEFLSGEDNMCHSLANLEYHHFKYAQFLRPGDVHVHYFGTATLSFADGVRTRPGDRFQISLEAFGAPLENTIGESAQPLAIGQVRAL